MRRPITPALQAMTTMTMTTRTEAGSRRLA
jgi:hypothetical protein